MKENREFSFINISFLVSLYIMRFDFLEEQYAEKNIKKKNSMTLTISITTKKFLKSFRSYLFLF